MTFRITPVLLVLFAVASSVHPVASAQDVEAVRLIVDNDNFNFWTPIDDQTDFEYTHGTRLEIDTRSVHPLQQLVFGEIKPCSDELLPDSPCVATTWSLTHQIYTPRTNSANLVKSERPYAGWLGLGAAIHQRDTDRRRTVSVQVGVTGTPSLAETSQVLVHELGNFWTPLGWAHQLRFEPAVLVGYTAQARRAASRGGWSTETIGGIAGNVGNLRTSFEQAIEIRTGYGVQHPWKPRAGTRSGISATLSAGASSALVLHNLFLDGTLFRSGHSVERTPLVGTYHLGLELGFRRLSAGFRFNRRSREYKTEPGGHGFSSITLSVRPSGT